MLEFDLPDTAERDIWVISSCAYDKSTCNTGPARLNSSFTTRPHKRNPIPARWISARLGVDSPPKYTEIPIMPSLPTVANSIGEPSLMTYWRETSAEVGK